MIPQNPKSRGSWIVVIFITILCSINLFAQTEDTSLRNSALPNRPPVPNAFDDINIVIKNQTKKTNRKSKTKGAQKEDSDVQPNRYSSKFEFMGKPMHLSCNKSVRNLKTNIVECFGNVYLRRPTEILTSDYAILNLNTEDMHAEGNVVYFTGQTVIYGEKMDFSFSTETGVIEDGRIESDRYELLGEHIERISDEEFIIKDGEYTTCKDCPASWRLAAKSVDFQVEGYAYLGNVYVKINEAPTVFLPYAIIPVKTQRQSGLLFPKIGTSELNGFMYVQPFYWAISRSTDATLGAGYYLSRGRKLEGEFRFSTAPRSKGQLNLFYLRDKKFSENGNSRFASEYFHNLVLPWKIEQKLHWVDSSDRDYARLFPQDISGLGEPALVSEAGLSRAGRDASAWLNVKRIRNNLTPETTVGFDQNTVQLMPSVSVATVDHRITDSFPLHWGITSNYSKFTRKAGVFDPIYPVDPNINSSTTTTQNVRSDFVAGETPLRQANRYMIVPELYFTSRLFDHIELVPSTQYRAFFYDFDTKVVPPTNRGYLISQLDLATNLEHIYQDSVKHKIRPSLQYSVIPFIHSDDDHPFNKQITKSGYQFDQYDIVPVTNDNQVYFTPLGHSITAQLGNKFILKSSENEEAKKYRKVVDINSGQTYNLVELKKSPIDRKPLSRFFTLASIDTVRVTSNIEYYYYHYSKASTFNISSSYVFAKYTKRLLSFERSIGINYSYNQVTTHTHSIGGNIMYSFNDYFQVLGGTSYQFPMELNSAINPGIILSINSGLVYQSPSQCYKLVLLGSQTFGRGWDVTFNIPVNLSGSTYTSFADNGFAVTKGQPTAN